MSKSSGVREIFSSKSMDNGKSFMLDGQESKQQLKLSNKNEAVVPPTSMKRFGGYKPKILANQTDFLEIQEHPDPAPTISSTSPDVSPPGVANKRNESRQPPQLTSTKPWVIGDKNTPMVLGSTDDREDADTSNQNELYSNDNQISTANSTRSLSVYSETSTLVRHVSDDSRQGIDNPLHYANGFKSSDDSGFTSSAAEITEHGSFSTQSDSEPDGVFIPAPDYDEEEKALDFNSDDSDDGGNDGKSKQTRPKSTIKIYGGEDFSRFMSEDDQDRMDLAYLNDSKDKSSSGNRPKLEKHSLFKQNQATKGKRKTIGSTSTVTSVRSFSYADSKYGTQGKSMGKSFSSSNLPDDSDIFLNANSQQGSYESFLRSRHGEDLAHTPSPTESDLRPGNAKLSNKDKENPVWKKLTVRLKNRLSKVSNS